MPAGYYDPNVTRNAGRLRPTRPLRPDLEVSPAARRALAAADAPVTKERFIHETDLGNVESIRKSGIRPSRGGSAMGHEGVYAYQGSPEGRRIPEGRALIEFLADPRRISGRGTMGSKAVALQGHIDPADVVGGYGTSGRLFDLGSRIGGLAGLLNTASSFAGLPYIQTPMDWALADMMERERFGSVRNPYYRNPELDYTSGGGVIA